MTNKSVLKQITPRTDVDPWDLTSDELRAELLASDPEAKTSYLKPALVAMVIFTRLGWSYEIPKRGRRSL